jgi:hypothetical protein
VRKQLRMAAGLAGGFAVMCGLHAWLGISRLLYLMFFGLLGWLASMLENDDTGAHGQDGDPRGPNP